MARVWVAFRSNGGIQAAVHGPTLGWPEHYHIERFIKYTVFPGPCPEISDSVGLGMGPETLHLFNASEVVETDSQV